MNKRRMSLFEKYFLLLLKEDEEACRSTFRIDKLGNRIEVPPKGAFGIGKNGVGVGIPKGSTAKEDRTGQLHVIPPGMILKIGANGKGVVVCPSESTIEKNGQIMKRKKSEDSP